MNVHEISQNNILFTYESVFNLEKNIDIRIMNLKSD